MPEFNSQTFTAGLLMLLNTIDLLKILSPTDELVSKFNVGLKTSEPEFYGDLVYIFKKIVSRTDFLISLGKS